jgi:hypothetical protein
VGDDSLDRFPMLWRWFKEGNPGVELKIHSDTLTTVLGDLANKRLDVALVSGRPRSDAMSKNLLVTRFRQGSGTRWLWVVRPELGTSSLAHAFERTLLESGASRTTLSKPTRIHAPRLRVVR